MKIGLYDPYLDTLGGGERFLLTIAKCLVPSANTVLFWDDKTVLSRIQERFHLDLDGLTLKKNIFSPDFSTFKRFNASREYDAIFYLSDGSIPLLGAKKVFPIVQFPLHDLKVKGIISRMKLLNTKAILCYSEYVKEYIQKMYPVPVIVMFPPVPQFPVSHGKESIILSVGRFTKGNNAKKQEVLIDFYKSHKLHFRGWKLVLAGGVLADDVEYVNQLKYKIGKDNIEIYENASFATLAKLYRKARIYWHAAGFGEDLRAHPEYAEHFGITTVEAMSAGAVPVVFNGGGQKEIVDDNKNGFVWDDLNELFHKTHLLMTDGWKWEELSKMAMKRALEFSEISFCTRISQVVTSS